MSNREILELKKTAYHPGVHLKEYLKDAELTQKQFSLKTGINKTIINEIIKGKRSITTSLAIKFESVLKIPADFWLSLQNNFDIVNERLKSNQLSNQIKEQVTLNCEYIAKMLDFKNTVSFTIFYDSFENLNFDSFPVKSNTNYCNFI